MLLPDRLVFGGRYRLQAMLGAGGMGTVWRALEVSLRREVALKFLPLSISRDDQAREELKKEVLLSQELTHPNIIRVHNFEEDALLAAISMELVEGYSLSKLKAERPNFIFSVSELAPWIQQLCGALAYAHRLNIIHRDLKPGNIMLSAKGQVKVVDFGIAASVSEANTRTAHTSAVGHGGTLSYMSPQQARGDKPTAADDLYSLGATLYECLTGKPPFFRGNVYAQVLEATPQRLNDRLAEIAPGLPAIPREWEETILTCLAKKREDRPSSADVVAARLFGGSTSEQVPPEPLPRVQSRGSPKPAQEDVLPPQKPAEKIPAARDRRNPWEGVALALASRVEIYRKVFGFEGTLKKRVIGGIGTLVLLGFIEGGIIDLSGAFGYGGWFHSGSAMFKVVDGWGRHVFTVWNTEKTALTFFALFLAVQLLLVYTIKRLIGFGRVSVTSEPAGLLVQTSSGKNLGRTPLLLRLMIPGRYRFRLVLGRDNHVELSGDLLKNQTLRLVTTFSATQKSTSL